VSRPTARTHAVAIYNLAGFEMADMHANPVVPFDNIEQLTGAILAHPAVIMLPTAAVERIERIAERGSAQMCPGEARLLHQVTQILRAIELAHGDEGAASPSRRMR
jgi:hypothetical protein